MIEKTADLHIHSYYSDGTMSPEEILSEAINNNVGLLAITDHDILEGAIELEALCRNKNIICLPGVELDALEESQNIHILGYGIDLNNQTFREFVRFDRLCLDTVNSKLIEKMQKDYDNISFKDYTVYSHDRRKGGWKALQYLMEKGLTASLREGFAFYDKYNCSYDSVTFPDIRTVCEQIHLAGGKAVLAHPGVSIQESDISAFRNKILKFLTYGIDGIECYYVKHTEEITQVCLDICKTDCLPVAAICNERSLLITAGSDCHGEIGTARIGDVNTPIRHISLGELLS